MKYDWDEKYEWDKIGKRILDNRESLNLSQELFGQKITDTIYKHTNQVKRISRQKVANWEHGEPIVKMQELAAIADICECDLGYILCEYDSKHEHDLEIHEKIGLSEIAIDKIKEDSLLKDTINIILNCSDGADLFKLIMDYLHADKSKYYTSKYNDDISEAAAAASSEHEKGVIMFDIQLLLESIQKKTMNV